MPHYEKFENLLVGDQTFDQLRRLRGQKINLPVVILRNLAIVQVRKYFGESRRGRLSDPAEQCTVLGAVQEISLDHPRRQVVLPAGFLDLRQSFFIALKTTIPCEN